MVSSGSATATSLLRNINMQVNAQIDEEDEKHMEADRKEKIKK